MQACTHDIISNLLHTYIAVSTVVHSLVFRADLFMMSANNMAQRGTGSEGGISNLGLMVSYHNSVHPLNMCIH